MGSPPLHGPTLFWRELGVARREQRLSVAAHGDELEHRSMRGSEVGGVEGVDRVSELAGRACIVMAYLVMADIVMPDIVMAYLVMVCIVMAYTVRAGRTRLYSYGPSSYE